MRYTCNFVIFSCTFLGACSPTIKVAPPEKPIKIDLNIKIDHEVKIKVDKQLDTLIQNREDLF